MNVNCKVSLTDEQRNKMFCYINGRRAAKKMVSRKDVNDFVQKKIDECLNGSEALPKEKTNDGMGLEFKPSRGDEPYLLKVKDESLRAIHSRMLDCIEDYEAAVEREIVKNTE